MSYDWLDEFNYKTYLICLIEKENIILNYPY